jgi:hypothetical protein
LQFGEGALVAADGLDIALSNFVFLQVNAARPLN